MTAVRKDLLDKIVVKYMTDLVNHLYFVFLEIWDLNQQTKWPGQKTQVFNVYDNRVGQGCTWYGHNLRVRQALKNIKWELIIGGRFLMAGDLNAHSQYIILIDIKNKM